MQTEIRRMHLADTGILKPFPNTFASDCRKAFISVRMCILGFLPEAVRGAQYVLPDYFTG